MSKDETKQQSNQEPKKSKQQGHIELTVPWPSKLTQSFKLSKNLAIKNNLDTFDKFLEKRSHVHETYIEQTQKTKRLGIVLTFLLILLAVIIMVFAPNGREKLSYWIGGALIIFSAGALGYSRVWGKDSSRSFGADQDKRPLE